jgi:hypothetical protein
MDMENLHLWYDSRLSYRLVEQLVIETDVEQLNSFVSVNYVILYSVILRMLIKFSIY